MSFLSWCKANCKHDFVLSDLIKDYQSICREQKALGLPRPKFTEAHLIEFNAQQVVIDAFRKARAQYADLIGRLKDERKIRI